MLIPVTNYRDLIYSTSNELLYITTDDGDVERFSLDAQQLLTPLNVGTELNGGDITADGTFLWIAEEETTEEEGRIYKVNLDTNAVEALTYERDFGEGGAWDITLAANGLGFVSTIYNGSGWTPIRELNLDTDVLAIRDDAGSTHNEVRGKTRIHRSGDRSILFFTEPNSSAGPMTVYDSERDSFPVNGEIERFFGNVAAVNRDGSILALPLNDGITLYGPDLFVLYTLDAEGRIAFDPTKDILYVANSDVRCIRSRGTEDRVSASYFPHHKYDCPSQGCKWKRQIRHVKGTNTYHVYVDPNFAKHDHQVSVLPQIL